MKISIIIPTRQTIPKPLLDSLSQQYRKSDEIIEVIGSSLTIQRNEAVKVAIGDIIVFLDDDIILEKSYLRYLLLPFEFNPRLMAITGNVKVNMYKTNSILTYLYQIYARIFRILHYGKGRYFLSGFSENYDPKINRVIKGEMLYGCNMAFRKVVFNEFKFDETIEAGMYGEDDFFAYPLSRKYLIYYTPFAICYDNRSYPKGKQTNKIRCTFRNLVRRHRKRNFSIITEIAFWWSMLGFTGFKIAEAIVMKDFSIVKGMILSFFPIKHQSIEDIRKQIKIRKLYV